MSYHSRTRRQFIADSGGALAGAAAIGALEPALGAEQGKKPEKSKKSSNQQRTPTLVTVFLRGGTDALSALVPYADPQYPEIRPNIALPDPDSKAEQTVLPLDERFGLNPNMQALHELWQRGMLAPIACVGSPHGSRSHFECQDYMERAALNLPNVTDGWLNRYLRYTRSSKDSTLRAVAPQPSLPRSLRGPYPALAVPGGGAERAMDFYDRLYPSMKGKLGDPAKLHSGDQARELIRESGGATIAQLRELRRILKQTPDNKEAGYPDSAFGRRMRDIAKLIKADQGLEVAALDRGGWDHHYNEEPLEGNMANKLRDTSDALGAFVKDLGNRMDRVLVLVMSEFGRTARENGNKGTDHGHGGFMLAIGGMVQGKQVYGKWTGLKKDKLYRKRDLPAHTDFRLVFKETLQSLYGFDGAREGFLPEYTQEAPPLEFLHALS